MHFDAMEKGFAYDAHLAREQFGDIECRIEGGKTPINMNEEQIHLS